MSGLFSSSEDSFGAASGSAGDKGTFIIQYGTETSVVDITDGMTVEKAFRKYADELGFDPDRQVQYRLRNQGISGNTAPVADNIYTAAITHEQKG